MARLGAKVSRSNVSSIPKNTFSFGIFWRNQPHTSFLGVIGYTVRSGAKLFWTKTLPNFASKALLNSFFPKITFSVWIFALNRTSPLFLAKRTRWHDDENQQALLKDPLHVPVGPITRARSKKIKEALNRLIQDIWADSTTGHSKLGPKEDEGVINLIQAADGADHA